MRLHQLFSKKTDAKVEAIQADITKTTKAAAKSGKELRDVLLSNGIGLQIVIAAGGYKKK